MTSFWLHLCFTVFFPYAASLREHHVLGHLMLFYSHRTTDNEDSDLSLDIPPATPAFFLGLLEPWNPLQTHVKTFAKTAN
jgi:hypothetical protein